jgi:hypothetical protein
MRIQRLSEHDDYATDRDVSAASRCWSALLIAILTYGAGLGCHQREAASTAPELHGELSDFRIYWPPQDPEQQTAKPPRPLLHGSLGLDATTTATGEASLKLVVAITRPAEEADRQFWNTQLAFADIAWMNQVRVWDVDHQWLWPNLPYLLRQPGVERVERYGGVDPGKNVDNDFAALLIRKYDADGEAESPDTADKPLVSAEWHADAPGDTDLETVVHVAKSDTFLLHLGKSDRSDRGRIKVWLIYADFLGSWPPLTWPKEREWAGGILSYFEIDWETAPGQPCRGTLRCLHPSQATRFDWAGWISGPAGASAPAAQARLFDSGT